MKRRSYYDHEPAYLRIRAESGRGWDDWPGGGATHSYTALKAFLGSRHVPRPGSDVRAVDLGCGGGQAALELARRGFLVTAVDYAPSAVDLAKANIAEAGLSVQLHVADCLALPFEDASFDLAVDNHVLHCLIGADRDRFLREASRVLKEGAILFSETMSAEGNPDWQRIGVSPHTRVDANQTRYWVRKDELLRELATSGFELLAIEARSQRGEDPYPGDTLVTVSRRTARP